MQATPRDVRYYITTDSRKHFREWLFGLKDIKARAKVRTRIVRLRQGNFGACRNLGRGLYELKINYGPGYRIYCGELGKIIIILLCGGDKRSQKRDIKKAKQYWQEFQSRL